MAILVCQWFADPRWCRHRGWSWGSRESHTITDVALQPPISSLRVDFTRAFDWKVFLTWKPSSHVKLGVTARELQILQPWNSVQDVFFIGASQLDCTRQPSQKELNSKLKTAYSSKCTFEHSSSPSRTWKFSARCRISEHRKSMPRTQHSIFKCKNLTALASFA